MSYRSCFAVAGLFSLLLSACAALPVAAQISHAERVSTPAPGFLKKDLADLTSMMTGRWDNDRQNFFAKDAGMDMSELGPRQHLIIEAIEGGDEPRLRAKRRVDGRPDDVLLHAFTLDLPRSAVRQTILRPGDGGVADVVVGCDVIWTRSAAGFSGQAEGRACPQIFPRPAEGGELNVTLEISDSDFWVIASRGRGKTEVRMRRARPFSCWVSILRGEKHGTTGEGSEDWTFDQGILLHDQYGEAIVTTDETPARNIAIRLRNVDWPYGTNRPSMTMYIHEAGNDRAISYAWTTYDADRIGINLRWLQASCTLSPDDLYGDF